MKKTELIKDKIKKYLEQRIEVDKAYNAKVKELKEIYKVGIGSRFIEEEKAKCDELETKAYKEFESIYDDLAKLYEAITDRLLSPVPDDVKTLIDLYGEKPEKMTETEKASLIKKCGNNIASLRYLNNKTGIDVKPLWAIADIVHSMIESAENRLRTEIKPYIRNYNDSVAESKFCNMITVPYEIPLRYNYYVNCLYHGYPFDEVQNSLDELGIEI